MKNRLTKEQIEEGKQEFTYINECYAKLVLDYFDANNYKNVFDGTEKTLEFLVYYEISVRCFYNIESNATSGDPELHCYYRTDDEKLPKLLKILPFKKGIKFVVEFKGEQIKSKMIYFTHLAKFTSTFESTILQLKTKFLNNGYC